MSKLPRSNKFFDVSDYGRPIAIVIANALKSTRATPIHLTISFIGAGLLAVACMVYGFHLAAAFFLILKSVLDAADGELARVKQTPSYIGRYFDSVSDFLLNAIFFLAIGYLTDSSILLCVFSFLGLQLQGTLYNYYYVIMRNKLDGDTTSRVIETHPPKAFPKESQKTVNLFFWLYTLLYGAFDRAIFLLDPNALKDKIVPKWFMTAVSFFGLGTQLLIISFMLVFGQIHYILPFFIYYSSFIVLFIAIRRSL